MSLALGIGANTTIFTVVNAVLLHPLPAKDISQLVEVDTIDTKTLVGLAGARLGLSFRNFQDYQQQNDVFTGITCFVAVPLTWSGGAQPRQVNGQFVGANYFDVLGLRTAAGLVLGVLVAVALTRQLSRVHATSERRVSCLPSGANPRASSSKSTIQLVSATRQPQKGNCVDVRWAKKILFQGKRTVTCTGEQLMSPTHCAKEGLERRASGRQNWSRELSDSRRTSRHGVAEPR